VKVRKQRLDSTHVLSDMAVLGRGQMLGVTLRRFFHQLEKHSPAEFDRVPQDMRKRYCKQSDSRIFGDVKTADERRVALQQVGEDMAAIIALFAETQPVCGWKSFTTLRTIFHQQCEVRDEFVEIRERVGGAVIQNPSDLEATYDGHKGAGYQVQICETHNGNGEPNLITSARVETAVTSDSDAVAPVLDDLKSRGYQPDELLADAGYGSHANVELAKENDVALVAPVPGGKEFDPAEVGYDQFTLNESREVVSCPAGHAPQSTNYNAKNDHVWAQMDPQLCQSCPLVKLCRVQKDKATGQANGRVQFRSSAPEAARRRRHEQTDEFKESYRWRSGIESTNAALKRRLGLGRLRVRGMKSVKQSVLMKLASWNILRAAALRAVRLQAALG
jgi:hypothetical protein